MGKNSKSNFCGEPRLTVGCLHIPDPCAPLGQFKKKLDNFSFQLFPITKKVLESCIFFSYLFSFAINKSNNAHSSMNL